MRYQVTLHAVALSDLRGAREWYESQQSGLGDALTAEVSDALAKLEISAEVFPIYYRGLRRVLTGRFPYKIFYRVEEARVVVLRILHSARDHRRELNS